MENWKPTTIFPDLYEVSDTGRVRRIKADGRRVEVAPKNQAGYMQFCLWSGGKPHWKFAHRLAFEAFNRPIPEGMEINHKNGQRSDNRIANLEAVTKSQNIRHKFDALGYKHVGVPSLGEKNGSAKLSATDVLAIRAREGEMFTTIAADYGVSPNMVRYIIKRKAWRHV